MVLNAWYGKLLYIAIDSSYHRHLLCLCYHVRFWAKNSLLITVVDEMFSLVKISGKLYKSCMCLILSQSRRWYPGTWIFFFSDFAALYFCKYSVLKKNCWCLLFVTLSCSPLLYLAHYQFLTRLPLKLAMRSAPLFLPPAPSSQQWYGMVWYGILYLNLGTR